MQMEFLTGVSDDEKVCRLVFLPRLMESCPKQIDKNREVSIPARFKSIMNTEPK